MIFVTVGTHEQPFNRLIKKVDELKREGLIDEEIMMQTGFSTYTPSYCRAEKLLSYQDMINNVSNAHIVITHGGPASFLMPLQMGKIPIVVPRQFEYHEHINNHQVEFCDTVQERMGNIIVVKNINDLSYIIRDYDEIIKKRSNKITSNNKLFCEKFEELINQMENDNV